MANIEWRTGCSGFYNRHWKGIFYPEDIPQSRWFDHYCQYFNTLELNVTFYKFPTPERLQHWYKKSPGGFLFSVKAPRLITHFKKLSDCERLLNDYYSACTKGLKEKLGCTLFQLPANIKYDEQKLEEMIAALHPEYRNVIEFRDESWWRKDVYDRLKEANIVFCTVEHPKLPDTVIANSSTVYVRLHGSPRMFYSNYTTEQLQQLHHSIKKKRGVNKVFVYFNNTAGEAGILNAKEFNAVVGSQPSAVR